MGCGGFEYFGNNEQITELKEDEAFWKFVYYGAVVGVILMLVLGIASLSSKGKPIFTEKFSLGEVPMDGGKGKLVGPINISSKGIHSIELRASNLTPNVGVFV